LPRNSFTGADERTFSAPVRLGKISLTAAPSAEAIRRDRIEEMSLGQAHLELHPAPRLTVIERPGGTGKLHCHPRTEASRGNFQAARDQLALILPFRRGESSRDCAIWTRLGGRQKLTNCNSNCEKEPVGVMSGRNERMSREEKPADRVASPVFPKAEGSTDASKTLEAMLSLVYDELRLLAGGYLRNERPEHTLQRTALVHEAYLRLASQRDVSWENPAHFLAIFARLMRQTLINHAIARTRAKRGGSDPTDLILEFYDRHQIDVTVVDEALRELEALDPRQAQIVELRFFGGLRIEEIAKLLKISPTTVKREWAVAKLWLRRTLSQGE
jgi:RNA polymerase sigma factor (TIGR02999 family)